jgi:hypothetical protein
MTGDSILVGFVDNSEDTQVSFIGQISQRGGQSSPILRGFLPASVSPTGSDSRCPPFSHYLFTLLISSPQIMVYFPKALELLSCVFYLAFPFWNLPTPRPYPTSHPGFP